MTRETLIKTLEHCLTDDKFCDDTCPLFRRADCRHVIYQEALRLLKEQPTATLEAVQAPGPDLIGSVMRQFKKPIITISISDMEDSQ